MTALQFEFEQPIFELKQRLIELKSLNEKGSVDLTQEIASMENKLETLSESVYQHLTPWQRVQISRHPQRPYAMDYIESIFKNFKPLCGDRCFGEDSALIGGLAVIEINKKEQSILVLGQQKGRGTKQKLERNFGMLKPEGYRKAIRLLELADRFSLPVLSLVDTPGAYPGIEAEQRGQAQAIAQCLETFFKVGTPSLSIVIGEGGSGGALALAVTHEVWMMEYATYSVISPESCASILWSNAALAEKASEKLKLTPQQLKELGVINGIIPEPTGGAHHNYQLASDNLKKVIHQFFEKMTLSNLSALEYRNLREDRFFNLGSSFYKDFT